ncbi:MAG TPA: xanthine dehydrogenase family protein molybdopterin-binding subunit, partial [Actinomycetospora sp.]|nr:xanthine dehydrogenase family protein molybdopterin-binding subunit [Actinomycetospora sp.]
MTQTDPKPTHVGQSLPRREDAALITGRGTWTDDIAPPATVHLALVRSPVAHARITAVDTAAARDHAGVVAVFTGAELAGEFAAGIPTGWPVTEDILVPEHLPVARDEVNHVGDAVAVV